MNIGSDKLRRMQLSSLYQPAKRKDVKIIKFDGFETVLLTKFLTGDADQTAVRVQMSTTGASK